jgi:hypothetical protein
MIAAHACSPGEEKSTPTGGLHAEPPVVIRYPVVPVEARETTLELHETLVISPDDAKFFRPVDLAVGDNADDEVLVYDFSQRRITSWTLDGRLRGSYRLAVHTSWILKLFGQDDGSVVAAVMGGSPAGQVARFAHFNDAGDLLSTVGEFGMNTSTIIATPGGRIAVGGIPIAQPRFAGSRDGLIFASPGEDYSITAYSVKGGRLWSVEVPKAPERATAEERESWRRLLTRVGGDDARMAVVPETYPIIGALRTDSDGNLYVFPFTTGQRSHAHPIEVYSPAGERLRVAMTTALPWRTSFGGAVYDIRRDEESDEPSVRRFELHWRHGSGFR